MKKNEQINVLVAMLPEIKDWDILRQELWYRIPIHSAPPTIKAGVVKYIAFYHTSRFDDNLKYKVATYGKIKQITHATRKQLFPFENPNHIKSQNQYYKVEIEELLELEKPFVSRRGHRITFLPTSEDKLFSKYTDFNILFKGSPLEEDMKSIIETMDIEYEREWEEYVGNKKYRLDFAIFCQRGNIDIECDGNEYHMGNENVHMDKTRNNQLESQGWAVLRYTTKHFKEERDHIKNTIYKKIEDYGGAIKAAEPTVPYFPLKENNTQLRLFREPGSTYRSENLDE